MQQSPDKEELPIILPVLVVERCSCFFLTSCVEIIIKGALNMPELLSSRSPVQINFSRIDNRAVVTLDGQTIYDRHFDNDRPLNESVMIDPPHGTSKANLKIEILNAQTTTNVANPWHVAFTMSGVGQDVVVDRAGTGKQRSNGVKATFEYEIHWDKKYMD